MARDLADVSLASCGAVAHDVCADALLDCAHIAGTTARLLGTADDSDILTIAMLVTICRRFAARCADTCASSARSELAACARTARAAVAAFDDLIEIAAEHARAPIDDDEVTIETIVLDDSRDDAVA